MSYSMYDGIKSKCLLYFQWRFTGHMSRETSLWQLRTWGESMESVLRLFVGGGEGKDTHTLLMVSFWFFLYFLFLYSSLPFILWQIPEAVAVANMWRHSRSKRHSGVWSLGDLPTRDFNCRATELENFTYLSAENSLSNNYMLWIVEIRKKDICSLNDLL